VTLKNENPVSHQAKWLDFISLKLGVSLAFKYPQVRSAWWRPLRLQQWWGCRAHPMPCQDGVCRDPFNPDQLLPCLHTQVFSRWESAVQLSWGARERFPVWTWRWNLGLAPFLCLFAAEQLAVCFWFEAFSRYFVWAFVLC